jgi:acetyl-CoA carboxylase biotin carboxylase subunit
VDLVCEQVRIASGEKLSLGQQNVAVRGWAMECRIYAEDPENHFLPCPGKVVAVRLPEGPGVRVDSAVFTGGEVSLHYDPMIAKVVAWGRNRHAAAAVMNRALQEFQIVGIRTNRNFLLQIVSHPEFLAGNLDTNFVPRFLGLKEYKSPGPHEVADIAAAIFAYESSRRGTQGAAGSGAPSAWRRAIQGKH